MLLAAQLMSDLTGPIAPSARLEYSAYFFGVNQITLGAIGGEIRVSGNDGTRIIGCGGDRQNTADRLDPKSITVFFNESGHLRNGLPTYA
jgi:hypothetical protein